MLELERVARAQVPVGLGSRHPRADPGEGEDGDAAMVRNRTSTALRRRDAATDIAIVGYVELVDRVAMTPATQASSSCGVPVFT